MFCHNCGKQIPDDTKFCHYCGAAQSAFASDEQPAPAQTVQPQQTSYQSTVQPQQAPYQSTVQPQQAPYQSTVQPQQAPYQSTVQHQSASHQSTVQPMAAQEQERVLPGILGALLGSLAGVVVMFILFKLEFVASLTGIIMLACAVWGYAHFGKVLSKKGIFFSILIVIIMIFVGNQLCWADYIYNRAGGSVIWWFFNLIDYIGVGALRTVENAYYECLTKQYAFAAVGVIFLAVKLFRGNQAAKK